MTKRKTYRWWLIFGLLLLALNLTLSVPVALAQDPAPTPTVTPPSFDRRFGLVDSFVNTPESNAAGAGWTRVFFRWDVVQPAGPSDWKPTNVPDPLIEAELAAGREVVAVLIGTPAWATPDGKSTAVPPLEYWGDFVFKIATQYRGRINHWVIWNQPDVDDPAASSHTWDGSVEDYYHLLKEAYQKIKTVDPQMQVHLAGLTYTWDSDRGQTQYLTRLLDLITADPQATADNYYFDAVTYHLYYNPHRIFDTLTEVHQILNAHSLGSKPIWINETNAPPSTDELEPLTAPAAISVTLEEQSAFVIQSFALALAGGAERIAFNKLRNDTPHPESVEPYGLLRADNSRRPAFAAFQVVNRYFAGTKKATGQQEGQVSLVTLDQDGQTTTVLWNTAATPTTFTLSALAPQAILVDEQGHEQSIVAASGHYQIELPSGICSGGPSACFIGGAPRLIVETGSPDQRPSSPPPSLPPILPTPTPTASPLASSPPPPPTLTPTPAPVVPPTPANQGIVSPPLSETPLTPPAALPALGLDGPSFSGGTPSAATADITPATPSPIPPVTVATVLRPDRLLWLFIIGLVVFTVSYGVQVVIWYRLRR